MGLHRLVCASLGVDSCGHIRYRMRKLSGQVLGMLGKPFVSIRKQRALAVERIGTCLR